MTHDVVIAGGGPNGLMLACELRLAGVGVLVLERQERRSGPVRSQGLVGRVVSVLDRRGLYAPLSPHGDVPLPAPFYSFGGMPLDLRGLGDHPLNFLPVAQPRLEEVLEARALELGAEIRRGHEAVGFTQDADGVRVEVRHGGSAATVGGRYLVGCDGASSTVRKLAGIGFPDTGDQDVVCRAADVVLPESYVSGDPNPADVLQHDKYLELPGVGRIPFGQTRTAEGFFVIAMFKPGIHVVGTTEWGRAAVDLEAPMTVEELRESVARVVGGDLPMTAPTEPGEHRLYRISGNSRQADRYRQGRVFLVGDAAHVHGAINGPGLNLGLQDAVNLAWKLANAIRGRVSPDVLDTYYDERHPVGERVLVSTQTQSALIAPGTDVTALRKVFGELLQEEGALRRVAELMAGSDVHYTVGPAAAGSHWLTGRWVPDLDLATPDGGVRLAELLRPARPVLLDLTGGPVLADAVAGWKDRLDVVAGKAGDAAPAAAVLIRPDGYAAWASDSPIPTEEELRLLQDVIEYWFGAPA